MRHFFDSFEEGFENLRTNGIKVNYWVVCKRKLWLYSKGLRMEALSDRVSLGRILHEEAYREMRVREVLLDNLIKVDIIDPEGKVLEIKHSCKLIEAARLQIMYYLLYLKYIGAGEFTGEIRFPKERRKEEVCLSSEAEQKVLEALCDIKHIEALPIPPQATESSLCRQCAYAELCWG
ncbi:MAG: CRISPR-associated protein Cas4 [Candidatus Caldatribacterium sp.]|uniref:CRISPR-associated protein Cas4 n=1 Tax=Candidatus Caldatribacterium sp. TaxID=2282143 RepID=UPI002991039E|nr:CRISPR-associated protein Cas4 [Candidatus Caldatribacterium sp.]MCX7729832.1 CRISPR-associated protein Cas4 [Candidatus Caldatribacterium sp.]MDW8082121.1 CRISPR-associated protein Cas4 [Candidatus Calescibacterium sp.]